MPAGGGGDWGCEGRGQNVRSFCCHGVGLQDGWGGVYMRTHTHTHLNTPQSGDGGKRSCGRCDAACCLLLFKTDAHSPLPSTFQTPCFSLSPPSPRHPFASSFHRRALPSRLARLWARFENLQPCLRLPRRALAVNLREKPSRQHVAGMINSPAKPKHLLYNTPPPLLFTHMLNILASKLVAG